MIFPSNHHFPLFRVALVPSKPLLLSERMTTISVLCLQVQSQCFFSFYLRKKNNFSDFRSSFLVYSHAVPMLRRVTRSQFLLLWSSLTIVVVGALVLHVEPFSRELTQESITIPCLLTLSKGYCFIFSASFLISCFFCDRSTVLPTKRFIYRSGNYNDVKGWNVSRSRRGCSGAEK